MEVILKVGAYAGKLRDVKPLYARGMIERGEAIDPNMPLAVGGEVASASALVGERAGETVLPTSAVDKILKRRTR